MNLWYRINRNFVIMFQSILQHYVLNKPLFLLFDHIKDFITYSEITSKIFK